MESLFDIDKFNIIEDEENYYFFRALNMADNQDLEAGVTLDNAGNIEKIRKANGIGFVLYPNQFEEFKKFILKLKERPTCKQFITYEEQFKFDKGVKK